MSRRTRRRLPGRVHPRDGHRGPERGAGSTISIGRNKRVGAGARVHQSIVLSISQNGDRVLGWNSVLGDWSRSRSFAKMENNPLAGSYKNQIIL